MHCKDQNQLGPAAATVAAIRISSAKQRSVRQNKKQNNPNTNVSVRLSLLLLL